MPAPVAGIPPELRTYLQALESRVGALETPAGPTAAYLTTAARLTAASAAQSAGRWAILTDLKTAAWSDGAHWRRIDTGAVIA